MANHGWQVIQQLPRYPQHCAVFPHLGQASGHVFIDTGIDISSARNDPHVYISDVAVAEMAKMFGMVPQSLVKSAQAELELERAKVEVLEEKVEDLERFKAAVDLVKSEIA